MKSLFDYVSNQHKSVIDCHVHLFGDNNIYNYPYKVDGRIVTTDNPLNHPEKILIGSYDAYMKDYNGNDFVLCVGKDINDTFDIWNTYKTQISGFGEVKCYKRCCTEEGEELSIYNTDILHYVINKGLPVFIHWDLDGEHDEELYNIIKNNPDTKFVLCHCGMNEFYDKDKSFKTAVYFQEKLTNLWLSISWISLDYFINNMTKLSYISIPDHTLVGTDFNPNMDKKDTNKRYNMFKKIYDRFDVPININNLFK